MSIKPTMPLNLNYTLPAGSPKELNDYVKRWDEVYRYLRSDMATVFADFVRRDGTLGLTGEWDVDAQNIINILNLEAKGVSTFGSSTQKTVIDVGQVTFIGDDIGLPYGELSVTDNLSETVILATGEANKVQFLFFDTVGEANRTTPDATENHILVSITGKYLVTISLAAESVAGAAVNMAFNAYKDNGTIKLPHIHAHRDFDGGGGDVGSISLSGISDFTAGDTLELWLWNESNTQNIIVEDVTMSLLQIGG